MRIVMYIVALLLILAGGSGLVALASQLRFHAPFAGYQLGPVVVPGALAALVAGTGVRMLQNLHRSVHAEDERDRRDARRGLKVALIVVCSLVGLAGLLVSLCGGLLMGSQYGGGAGSLVLAGGAVLLVALLLILWAARSGE